MTIRASLLIIDENPLVHEIIAVALEPAGFQLFSAFSGMAALEQVETTDFDLILLDLMMPGMDGFQICAELRKQTQAPILIVTALDDPAYIAHAHALGADDHLFQPYDGRDLLRHVTACLALRPGGKVASRGSDSLATGLEDSVDAANPAGCSDG